MDEIELIGFSAVVDGITERTCSAESDFSAHHEYAATGQWRHPKGKLTGKTSIEFTLKITYKGYEEIGPIKTIIKYHTGIYLLSRAR